MRFLVLELRDRRREVILAELHCTRPSTQIRATNGWRGIRTMKNKSFI